MIVDNFGNTASITGIETYSCDFESHMTQREASGGSTDTHEYDGDGRRVRSNLDDAADWTHFIHDELTENLICEYTLISGTFTIKALNTYGLCLISSNRQGTIRYFHFDGLGTTYHLTDTSQTVTDSYSYDAFGVPISVTGSSVNPYRYVGQWGYYDDGAMGSSSGMLLLGVRYYWPRYGRFSVWDGRAYQNRYEYARNEASIAADPSGYDIVYCYRKVVTSAEGHSHPYLRTNLCGVIGLTGSTEGIVIGVLDDPQKGQGYCERVNAGGEDPTCRTLRLSVAQERCICQNAINAKKGWTLCGRRWLAGDYDWYGNNSQHFIIALLMKCTGGGDEIPYFGNRPFNLEDCQ
jgi:RHS repeat-associated protein